MITDSTVESGRDFFLALSDDEPPAEVELLPAPGVGVAAKEPPWDRVVFAGFSFSKTIKGIMLIKQLP